MTVNLERAGGGPPLVLLHGVGHHWQAWQPVMDVLAAEFSIVAVDSPGFGRSAPLPASIDPTIPNYAAAFERLFADLGLDRPHVAGSSMGGAIGLELARRGVVSSVAAFSPAGFWTPRELRFTQLSLAVPGRMPHALRGPFAALLRAPRGRRALMWQNFARADRMPAEEAVATMRDAWDAPAFAAALEAFDRYRFADGDELRGTPVTIAWGVKDRLLPYGRQAPRARAELPWARHLALGGGHVPFYDDPAAAAEVIRLTAASSVDRAASRDPAPLP